MKLDSTYNRNRNFQARVTKLAVFDCGRFVRHSARSSRWWNVEVVGNRNKRGPLRIEIFKFYLFRIRHPPKFTPWSGESKRHHVSYPPIAALVWISPCCALCSTVLCGSPVTLQVVPPFGRRLAYSPERSSLCWGIRISNWYQRAESVIWTWRCRRAGWRDRCALGKIRPIQPNVDRLPQQSISSSCQYHRFLE